MYFHVVYGCTRRYGGARRRYRGAGRDSLKINLKKPKMWRLNPNPIWRMKCILKGQWIDYCWEVMRTI